VNASPQTRTEHLIELACRAPSVHNTQPWRWRVDTDQSVALWADRDRQLPVADPEGRNLAISCGAALHHFVVAGRAMGVAPVVELMPSAEEPDLLATINISAGRPSTDAAQTLKDIERRCTDRRRFTSWPIPETRLTHLAQAAAGWGAYAMPIVDVSARFRAELLLSRARTAQEADPRFAHEQQAWTGHSAVDGIPRANAAPHSRALSGERPNRFAPERAHDSAQALVEGSDGLMAICTAEDDQRAWLEAGQVLSALWLRATRDGLSLVPLSQVIEVPETRNALHFDLFAAMAHPQILLRIGWQEIGRASLVPTPRRPLSDVLLP
jgi:hypothetical protein